MNKIYETAIIGRETAAAEFTRKVPGLDIQVGDVVQLRADGKPHAGKIGQVIGIRYIKGDKTDLLGYTIKFSDKKSVEVNGARITILRPAQNLT